MTTESDEQVREQLLALKEALQQSEYEAQTLFDSSVFGRAEADVATSRFRRVNECFCTITGYSRSELLAMPVHQLTHPGDKADDWENFSRMLRGEIPEYVAEKRYVRKDGKVIWVQVAAHAVRDAHGAAHHTIGIIADITPRKEAEAERERVLETLAARVASQDKFMAMLAHELRNPLAPIRNSCFILDRTERDSDHARRARAVIERQVAHMAHLIDELLDITRIVTGKVQLHPVAVELSEVVDRTVADHQSSFAAVGVELAFVTRVTRCWVDVDVVRIVQVLGNLLGNAVKFTPRGGHTVVTVDVDADRREAVVSVRDDGPGIAPDLLPTLFDPFTQAPTTLDRSSGGLGLGLAVVKGLVEMHRGSVGVRSEGTGTEFTIRIPLRTEAREPAVERGAEPAAPARAARVLLIEDNADAAETLRVSLELCRHQVEVAEDGPTGIAKAHGFGPDVVVCDIGLPGMTGYEVARSMRADPTLAAVPLVALSGYASASDKAAAKAAGFDDHVAKPVSIHDLETILARFIREPHAAR
jgi:PAS domain S-box-containing protein